VEAHASIVVGGPIEAPLLSECLTLAKNDFIRTGQKGAVYLAFRKALQEAVSDLLSSWGEGAGEAEPTAPEKTRIPEAAIDLAVPGRRARKKPMHLGLKLQFESRPESAEPGRLAENIIWINEAHPAYRRAASSRSEGYHIALSAAMALSTVAVEPREQRAFVNAFLTRWGEALEDLAAVVWPFLNAADPVKAQECRRRRPAEWPTRERADS
jgi:hypothetical protein